MKKTKSKIEILEGYPDRIKARIELRDKKRRKALPTYVNNNSLELVLEDLKLWRVGTLNVSFKGGNSELHKKIADVANLWSDFANITFDFGETSSTYRMWKPNDTSHIRIGFSEDGYWSLVGTDCKDESIVPNGEISMNFQGFDTELPEDWKGTVLHEFGHALGFHHEHQTPAFSCDFDWDKLYEFLAGPPNNWSRATVDHNLKQLPAGGLTFSPHDPGSIMHYAFPAWMFANGEQSPCFTQRNDTLSEEDKKMAAQAYPGTAADNAKIDERKKEHLTTLLSALDIQESPVRTNFTEHLKFLKENTAFNMHRKDQFKIRGQSDVLKKEEV